MLQLQIEHKPLQIYWIDMVNNATIQL